MASAFRDLDSIRVISLDNLRNIVFIHLIKITGRMEKDTIVYIRVTCVDSRITKRERGSSFQPFGRACSSVTQVKGFISQWRISFANVYLPRKSYTSVRTFLWKEISVLSSCCDKTQKIRNVGTDVSSGDPFWISGTFSLTIKERPNIEANIYE